MIAEVSGGIANGGTLTALLSAELDIDVDTPSQRLEMLERMREQARALPGEGACGSTGACRGCASAMGPRYAGRKSLSWS